MDKESMQNDPRQSAHEVSRQISRVCVFCGSSAGNRPIYQETAARLGTLMAERGIGLVYGGGCVGLMGVTAEAAMKAGGEVIGVIPGALVQREVAHNNITELRVVDTMHQRKALMADLSDAFVMLPGGYGSLDEFCEIVTWLQLGIHHNPCGILNVEGYYDSLLAQFDRAVKDGFISPKNRGMILVEDDPERLLDRLHSAPLVHEVRWVTESER